MRKAIASMMAIGIMAVLFLMSVPPASATKPVFTFTNEVSFSEDLLTRDILNDQVTKWTWTTIAEWQGDWNGITTGDCWGNWRTRGDPYTGGALLGVNYKCDWTFTGTVLGRSGTVYLHMDENLNLQTDPMVMIWSITIQGGTGELQGIHGTAPLGIPSGDSHGRTWRNGFVGWAFWIHFE